MVALSDCCCRTTLESHKSLTECHTSQCVITASDAEDALVRYCQYCIE